MATRVDLVEGQGAVVGQSLDGGVDRARCWLTLARRLWSPFPFPRDLTRKAHTEASSKS
jgi:hypothetical protein